MTDKRNHAARLDVLRLDGEVVSMGCQKCPLLGPCGGLTARGGGWNCMERCKTCDQSTCDAVCMTKPDFARRLMEIGNDLGAKHVRPLKGPADPLPRYVPVLQHRRVIGDVPLPIGWAAIPLALLMRSGRRGEYGPRVRTSAELRACFNLAPGTKVVVLGTGEDEPIERYWKLRRRGALDALAELDVSVIPPNYSVFLDDPRTQHMFNRRRSLACADEWGARHIPIIPYLHGITAADYEFWADFLREHTEITAIAKEFQTGAGNEEIGNGVLTHVEDIQQRLGRPLHLVAIGGARHARRISANFGSWTVMDSAAFMKAVHRRIAVRRGSVIEWEFAADEDVADLFFNNIRVYDAALAHTQRTTKPPLTHSGR